MAGVVAGERWVWLGLREEAIRYACDIYGIALDLDLDARLRIMEAEWLRLMNRR